MQKLLVASKHFNCNTAEFVIFLILVLFLCPYRPTCLSKALRQPGRLLSDASQKSGEIIPPGSFKNQNKNEFLPDILESFAISSDFFTVQCC